MVIWDDAIQNCVDFSNDSSVSSLAIFKRMLNVGYKYILAELGRPISEKTLTSTTVAQQQYYQLPNDFQFMKTLTITVGGIAYPVQEEESQEMWDYMNARPVQGSNIPEIYFNRPNWGVAGAEFGVFPIPSSSGNTMTIVYEAGSKDLQYTKVTSGTVNVTNGSASVTGVGTSFTSNMAQDWYFRVDSDGVWYKISAVADSTHLTLENVYEGISTNGTAFTIAQCFAFGEDLQMLPVYYALAHYFGMKKDKDNQVGYLTLFQNELVLGKERYGTKSRSAIVRGKRLISRWQPWGPLQFPGNITGS